MLTSIIVPLFNRFDLTLSCVAAVEKRTENFELILVDNGSNDGTADYPVTVRNPRNRGFARACNQGALRAKGDVLVFLNNDTEVQDGWLPPLHAALREFKVAGPKLIYPDGRVQSCGVSVDFSRAYSQEALPITSEVGYGPVDAVSGACLAIRAEHFDGFDTAFYNGYEDIDLCLSVGSCGVNPDSVVVHLESQSDRRERFRAVRENIDLLRRKWQ